MPSVSENQITWSNWTNHVIWTNIVVVIIMPFIGFIWSFWVPLQSKTALFTVFYAVSCGFGVTAGAHRLWAHRSFKATFTLKVILAALNSASGTGTILRFVKDHRAHHRYTDTDQDPHSVDEGFFYSHILWIILKRDPKRQSKSDITDVVADSVVMWQYRNYKTCFLCMGFLLPMGTCGIFWGDWLGGLVYGGIIRTFIDQQSTFCINSVTHWLGDQPFDTKRSATNNFIAALISNGEGYHNFHHQFPSDYRAGIEWYQYDPTKWAIYVWEKLGLAYNLKRFRYNEISKRRIQEQQKIINETSSRLEWGTPLHKLPVISWDDFLGRTSNGEVLIVVSGVVCDVGNFLSEHPGGRTLILSAVGKDATTAFYGGIYSHSNNAHNLLELMQIGVIYGGGEVESFKNPSL